MKDVIETMMEEHRLIERVLGALDTFIGQLPAEVADDRGQVARFARFFKNFADRCHHGKEEERLFVVLNQCGFPREYGPVGVMLAEHTEGRGHVGALAEIGAGRGPLSPEEKRRATGHALAFIPLLKSHIQKEDNILYPMARQGIPPAQWTELEAACEAFDRDVMGVDEIQELRDLATELTINFPPDMEKMAALAGCAGCRGH